MKTEISFKGKTIMLIETGFYQMYSDLHKRFMKFDTLDGAKFQIRNEISIEKKQH